MVLIDRPLSRHASEMLTSAVEVRHLHNHTCIRLLLFEFGSESNGSWIRSVRRPQEVRRSPATLGFAEVQSSAKQKAHRREMCRPTYAAKRFGRRIKWRKC